MHGCDKAIVRQGDPRVSKGERSASGGRKEPTVVQIRSISTACMDEAQRLKVRSGGSSMHGRDNSPHTPLTVHPIP